MSPLLLFTLYECTLRDGHFSVYGFCGGLTVCAAGLQVVLTGHPIRVRKKVAVVKHLFYDPQVTLATHLPPSAIASCYLLSCPGFIMLTFTIHLWYGYIVIVQDVRWFKPAELTTKFGLRGHIKEAVGTHGLLKAHFSDVIKQNDTVMLSLYKRVYPKFPKEGLCLT